MSKDDSAVVNWLAAHPKMTGALFTALLLSQTAGVAAANGSACMGP